MMKVKSIYIMTINDGMEWMKQRENNNEREIKLINRIGIDELCRTNYGTITGKNSCDSGVCKRLPVCDWDNKV